MAPAGLVLSPVALFFIPEQCHQAGAKWVFRVIWGMVKPETGGCVYKHPGMLAQVSLLPMVRQAGLGRLAKLPLHLFLFRVLKAIEPYGEVKGFPGLNTLCFRHCVVAGALYIIKN